MLFKKTIFSIIKYIILIAVFFFAVNLTINSALNKVEARFEARFEKILTSLDEDISLEKLKNEIITAAEKGGISEEDKEKIGKSLAIIYKRDILPLFDFF
tara:strand:+ start:137 stop:436 length:300 start_codon:yes stop_codon:yes gene_type:complete